LKTTRPETEGEGPIELVIYCENQESLCTPETVVCRNLIFTSNSQYSTLSKPFYEQPN
jgi:hypothetical protein